MQPMGTGCSRIPFAREQATLNNETDDQKVTRIRNECKAYLANPAKIDLARRPELKYLLDRCLMEGTESTFMTLFMSGKCTVDEAVALDDGQIVDVRTKLRELILSTSPEVMLSIAEFKTLTPLQCKSMAMLTELLIGGVVTKQDVLGLTSGQASTVYYCEKVLTDGLIAKEAIFKVDDNVALAIESARRSFGRDVAFQSKEVMERLLALQPMQARYFVLLAEFQRSSSAFKGIKEVVEICHFRTDLQTREQVLKKINLVLSTPNLPAHVKKELTACINPSNADTVSPFMLYFAFEKLTVNEVCKLSEQQIKRFCHERIMILACSTRFKDRPFKVEQIISLSDMQFDNITKNLGHVFREDSCVTCSMVLELQRPVELYHTKATIKNTLQWQAVLTLTPYQLKNLDQDKLDHLAKIVDTYGPAQCNQDVIKQALQLTVTQLASLVNPILVVLVENRAHTLVDLITIASIT